MIDKNSFEGLSLYLEMLESYSDMKAKVSTHLVWKNEFCDELFISSGVSQFNPLNNGSLYSKF